MLDHILKKNWTPEDIIAYVGNYREAVLACSSEENIRERAASGGTTTALLIYALETGLIDGALVCKEVLDSGKVRAQFFVATTRNEILAARGSKYVATNFSSEALKLIKSFSGRLAVVGLPCDISLLTRWCQRTEISSKVVFKLALMCGHNSNHVLIDAITTQLEKKTGARLVAFKFRVGLWRGKIEAKFDNGQTLTVPSSYFTLYQNLFFFSEKKCLYCHDHFGYDSDIVLGDVWLYKYKTSAIKYNGVIIKTESGNNLLCGSRNRGVLEVKSSSIEEILDSQTRSAPFHYNVTARYKAAKWFGVSIPDAVGCQVRWYQYVAALIVVFNIQLSESRRFAPYIFRCPRPVLKLYLYLLKALESLK